jgi:hypothetical protein
MATVTTALQATPPGLTNAQGTCHLPRIAGSGVRFTPRERRNLPWQPT